MNRLVFSRHDGVFDGMAVRSRGGTLHVSGKRWQIRFWTSGAAVGGPVLRTKFEFEPLTLGRSRVAIESCDGRYRAALTVFARAATVEHRLAAARTEATEANTERRLINEGQWWLDHRVFAELGPAEAISLVGTRYVGGWTGPIRFEGGTHPGILDLDANGITLRRVRHHLQIPWKDIRKIDVSGNAGSGPPTTLCVRVRDDNVRFESQEASADEVRRGLAPVIRRIDHAATVNPGTTG